MLLMMLNVEDMTLKIALRKYIQEVEVIPLFQVEDVYRNPLDKYKVQEQTPSPTFLNEHIEKVVDNEQPSSEKEVNRSKELTKDMELNRMEEFRLNRTTPFTSQYTQELEDLEDVIGKEDGENLVDQVIARIPDKNKEVNGISKPSKPVKRFEKQVKEERLKVAIPQKVTKEVKETSINQPKVPLTLVKFVRRTPNCTLEKIRKAGYDEKELQRCLRIGKILRKGEFYK